MWCKSIFPQTTRIFISTRLVGVAALLLLGMACQGLTLRNADGVVPMCGDNDPDQDGDGICDSADMCAGFDDGLDSDLDGSPDGCDLCPDDVDLDEDTVCDAIDPCPNNAANTCEHDIQVALQVDQNPSDATWKIIDGFADTLIEGGFEEIGEVVDLTFPVPGGSLICVELSDYRSDGGVAGFIYDKTTNHTLEWWDRDAYASEMNTCITVEKLPIVLEPLDESHFDSFDTTITACSVQVRLDTVKWAEEIGWSLQTADGKLVTEVVEGTLERWTQYATDVSLLPDDYIFILTDTYGDGWNDSTFEIIDLGTQQIYAAGTLPNGHYGEVVFTVPEGC